MLSIDEIKSRLRCYPHEPTTFEAHSRQAAVAMILTQGVRDLNVCFIRRAEREGDPWSGQVAFPGGRAESSDTHASAVAERETFEEIGLRLDPKDLVAPLPVRPIQRQSLNHLSPFVYYVDPEAQEIARVREKHEVASVFWVPLRHLFDETSATELEYPMGGTATRFPGIQFGEHVIWGLTLRVLESFAEIMQLELAAQN